MAIQYWRLMRETVSILKDIDVEIEDTKRTLTTGLLQSQHLDREYSYYVGKLQGLELIKEAINNKEEIEEDE